MSGISFEPGRLSVAPVGTSPADTDAWTPIGTIDGGSIEFAPDSQPVTMAKSRVALPWHVIVDLGWHELYPHLFPAELVQEWQVRRIIRQHLPWLRVMRPEPLPPSAGPIRIRAVMPGRRRTTTRRRRTW
ncbi:hypothetical protein [Nonomuraea sp. NPDC005650]|uniref:hypothetical protein n=1 Tax=Nonomuraea sp. NPDC005650 TaxID=3157045 RepID=UPI0033B1CA37